MKSDGRLVDLAGDQALAVVVAGVTASGMPLENALRMDLKYGMQVSEKVLAAVLEAASPRRAECVARREMMTCWRAGDIFNMDPGNTRVFTRHPC